MNNYSRISLAGKFHLCRDTYNIWIEEEFEGRTESGARKKSYRRVTGYFKNIKDVFQDFSEMQFRTAEAKDVAELLRQMAETQATTENAITRLYMTRTAEKR